MSVKVYLKILMIILFHTIEFFIIEFFIADELFLKTVQSLKTCILVNNNLFGKLFSSFFIPDFNLLCCELDNFSFKVLY